MTEKESAVSRVDELTRRCAIHWRKARDAGDCEERSVSDQAKARWQQIRLDEDWCFNQLLEEQRDIVRDLEEKAREKDLDEEVRARFGPRRCEKCQG